MTTTPPPTPPEVDPLDDLRDLTRDALLDQYANPETIDGTKGTRFDLGVREGRIVAHTETLAALHPRYTGLDAAAVRIVLLGEALARVNGDA